MTTEPQTYTAVAVTHGCLHAPNLIGKVKSDAKREEAQKRLGLHPATGKIITIGMWDIASDRGYVLFEDRAQDWHSFGRNV